LVQQERSTGIIFSFSITKSSHSAVQYKGQVLTGNYLNENCTMRLTLFIVAALLTVSWILGAFVFKAGTFVHIFVITAVLSFMQGIIFTPKQTER
jgi:hypothetical protein